MFKRDGGAFSSGNSIFDAAREGQKRDKSKQENSPGGPQNRWAEAGGAGSGKGGKRNRQRGSKLSNKQEKAKGKAQESRHQNRFPPLFYRAPPSGLNIVGLFFLKASGISKLKILIFAFLPEGFWFTCGKCAGAGYGPGSLLTSRTFLTPPKPPTN